MNENKNYETEFNFKVFQGENLLIESIFPTSATNFHPLTRNFVDIREQIPNISNRLHKVLSLHDDDLVFEDYDVNLKARYINTFKLFNNNFKNSILAEQIEGTFTFKDNVFNGVPCRFGLYINDNPIVERDFYVKNYNPNVRVSFNLYYLVEEIVVELYDELLKIDKKNIWDDYTLINKMNFSFQQIREFSRERRNILLAKI